LVTLTLILIPMALITTFFSGVLIVVSPNQGVELKDRLFRAAC